MDNNQPTGRESVSETRTPNPAKFFASWDSTKKQWSFYDKVNKVDVPLPLPFAFIPLFQMTTLKGYNHKENKSYWSNEVKDITTEKFTVMSKNNITKEVKTEFVGLYSELKPLIDGRANYTQSLYVGVKDNQGVLQLANIQINTSSLKSWINFVKTNDISKVAVQVASFTNEVNGAVHFTSPVYTPLPVTPQVDAAAGVLQKQIKEYIAIYTAEQAARDASTTFKTPEPITQQPINNQYQQNTAQPVNNGFGQQQPINNGFGNQNTAQPVNNGFGQPQNNGFGQNQAPVNNGFNNQQPVNNGFGQPQQNTAQSVNNGFQTTHSIPATQQQQQNDGVAFGGEIIRGNPLEDHSQPPF